MQIRKFLASALVLVTLLFSFVLFASASLPTASTKAKLEKTSPAKYPPGVEQIRDLTEIKTTEIRYLSYKTDPLPVIYQAPAIRFGSALLSPSSKFNFQRIPFKPPNFALRIPKDKAGQIYQARHSALNAERRKPNIVQLN